VLEIDLGQRRRREEHGSKRATPYVRERLRVVDHQAQRLLQPREVGDRGSRGGDAVELDGDFRTQALADASRKRENRGQDQ
jgi:hypothetical protein